MKYIAPNELYLVWDYVKAGLEHLLRRAPDRWQVEDVFHHIKAGNFYLHMTQNDGVNTGFVVLQVTEGWKGLEMHVFAAYSLDPKVMDYALDQVKELAKKLNVKFLKFTSNRKGWEKRAIELGYKYENTTYEIDLTKQS